MQTARDKIRELRALHDDGLLTGEEFERRKNAILDAEYTPGGTAPPPARQGTELGLMAGQEIGPQHRRYRLERLLGMGGMGQVWQATDLATHAELGHSEQVAVKILPPQLTQSPVHARLLVEEATQARRLAHDSIVRVYEWAQDPATASYFIIMECLDGQDLDAWLASHGPVPFGEVERILRPVASALQYAWDRHRLVHRDLKPGNVFLTAQGDIKLLDFGIAARSRDATAGLPELPNAGTAVYRAPETGTQQALPLPRLDVYAVAVMVYQMLAGTMPFDDTRSAQSQVAPPPGLNDAQWRVLQQGFAFDPEQRFDSVTALLDALRRAAGPSPEELAAQAAAAQLAAERREHERQRAQLKEAEERLHAEQRAMEQARAAGAEEQRRMELQRKAELQRNAELVARRRAEAQAEAVKKLREEQARRAEELQREKQRRLEADAAAQARKEQLRQQLLARREADAAKARAIEEEKQRKAALLRAQAAYKAEQERARRDQAARNAAELAALMPTAASPVADASGVLRDRFLDGSAVGPDLVLIPTGRFQMGGTEHEHVVARKAGSQPSWLARELPTRWVAIERSFALGRYPVTVGEWRRFVRATAWESKLGIDWTRPGFEQDDWHPVVNVSWHDAQQYVRWLSMMTGALYRLPSEAEWEYACRAGSRTAFACGDEIGTEYANYDGHFTYGNGVRGEFRGGTSKVGSFQPNGWGLYDMHGNVWEWTQDAAHDDYNGAPCDGSAWEDTGEGGGSGGDPDRRMVRGGAWLYPPRYVRSAARNGFSALLSNDVVGFRVARRLG
ncbi:SUMF1/EgtB/PvdO family nonheme iron enzyme [Pseudoduganella umbonata]|uniref:Formylglycine-generating enzyme required for sulfatase activity n=1 Tax=Pseudoduganella umbonata TaxID=864828 RepID=A0A4P8HIZ9_9BURK|nr:SUMF1/EgtB/PvdO family nonheme iron enzyme [Pseudoduganella umbonata]MBB3219417.1 formylglycine-generating enzyme required for sulfatase activity [Pseudoduganella umbonata]QCP09507.1 serine/threonine protein kinase [Pseudoduganella umbonata]